MNGASLFFLLLLLLVILPVGGWIGYTRWRAHQQGLPPPPWSSYIPFKKSQTSNYPAAPRQGGAIGWVKDKWANMQSHRAGSGYAGARRGERGFGSLDPDAAWDDRVGHEADAPYGGTGYEEQELGLHPPGGTADAGPYGMHGGGYAGSRNVLPEYGQDRGRTRSREDLSYVGGSHQGLDDRYDEVVHGQSSKGPYGGGNGADSGVMRALSPRPHELDTTSTKSGKSRSSMFREEI